ncbi:hypothetical protein CBR_g9034 [Chara braunii]|uniref:Uncharacterized protein n=1 Tax=Chara braunii TaxID=69332 RepID=A0A388KNN5_CHABU|nr:hypothetical protein CBR_g9034 [Chara braunii]|eukprot:GBG71618.1 hypothetical protein CBR_g9034 [Chara braunii]
MSVTPVAPSTAPPGAAPWVMQLWPANAQWPDAIPWQITPVSNAQQSSAQVPSVQGGDLPAAKAQSNGDSRSSNHNVKHGKGPAANAFPDPGNRAYFTKEYMDILEDIKSEKILDATKKRVVGSRMGGVRISDSADESCRSEVRSSNEADEMKAWVTSTLGDSLKSITKKLDEVDFKAKLATAEKKELLRLRAEKAVIEKVKKESSSEKRKRGAVAEPMVVTPASNANRCKTRSRGSSIG